MNAFDLRQWKYTCAEHGWGSNMIPCPDDMHTAVGGAVELADGTIVISVAGVRSHQIPGVGEHAPGGCEACAHLTS